MKLEPYITARAKTNTKRIKDLKLGPKIIKVLEESIEEKLPDIKFGNDFLDMTPKVLATKEKSGHRVLHEKFKNLSIKSFNRIKRQPTNGKKFANPI